MAANIHLRPGHYVDDPNVGAGDAAWARVIAAPPQQIAADSARIQQQVDDHNLPQNWPGGQGNNPIDPQVWNQRFAGPRVDQQQHQAQLGDIRGLFDRLTRHIQTQRTDRQQTNNYVLELERLIAKLRDCITRLLDILVRTRNNMDALNALRDDMNNAPDLEAIREQLEASVTYMINDELDPDAFRAQLVALVTEINRICLEVENMRPYAQQPPPDDGGGQGGYPAVGEARGARGLGRGARGARGRGARGARGRGARGLGRGGQPRRGPPGRGSARHDEPNRGGEEKKETRSEETKDDGDVLANLPPGIRRGFQRLNAQADAIGDGGDGRRREAARIERQLRRGSGNQPLGFGSSTGRGGWQTPEKLESLSKSKPIRTLDSIKRKKSKRGNKSKRRRKKTKGRRNKKKKQTKRKRNKKRKKKRTRKR